MNIKTPFSYMEETEIISVNRNVATVRGYVADRSGRREVVRDFPVNALRKSEYRKEVIAENNRFGNIIDWNGHIIEKSIINGQLLNFYLKNEEGNINLSPEYQRDFVWTLEQKQEYIMALLKSRAEIRPVFIQEFDGENEKFEVVDGKQRLNSIFGFINDEFSLEDGTFFSQLSEKDVKKILRFNVEYTRFISFTDKIPYDFKLELFLELNAKGTEMSKEQINKVQEMAKKHLTIERNMI
jgi:hypothetical protein